MQFVSETGRKKKRLCNYFNPVLYLNFNKDNNALQRPNSVYKCANFTWYCFISSNFNIFSVCEANYEITLHTGVDQMMNSI